MFQWKPLPCQPFKAVSSSWKVRHCGHWGCRSSVEGVFVHTHAALHAAPARHFLRWCMCMQQHCLPSAMGWAQKTCHSAENLTVCLCPCVWALWSCHQVMLASFDLPAWRQRCGFGGSEILAPSAESKSWWLGRMPVVTKHNEMMRTGTTTVQCAACPWQQSWNSFIHGKYTQKP